MLWKGDFDTEKTVAPGVVNAFGKNEETFAFAEPAESPA